MNLLYVDESGDTGKTGTDHLVLGAAALFEGKWRHLRGALAGLLSKYYPDPAKRPAEVHCAHLRSGKGLFGALAPAERVNLFADLVSRFDLFLKRRYREGFPSKGLIIADSRNSALSRALRKTILQFHETGTPWATMENVIESVLFLASHESPGLQLADLCSYAVWRVVTADDAKLARELKYCFDREPMTSTGAAGKWHGVKYVGQDVAVRKRIHAVWA